MRSRVALLTALLLALAACGAARSQAPEVPGPSAGADVQRSRVLVPLVSMLWPGRDIDAVTIGSTIHMRVGEPLAPSFVAHELCHVAQWKEGGWLGFPIKYLVAVILPGNRFERECRRAEALE